jgi:hypothetical protein
MEDRIIRQTFGSMVKVPSDFLRGRRVLKVRPVYRDELLKIGTDERIMYYVMRDGQTRIVGTWRNSVVTVLAA